MADGHGGKRAGAGRKCAVEGWLVSYTHRQVLEDFRHQVLNRRAIAAFRKAAEDVARGVDARAALRTLVESLMVEVPPGEVVKEVAKRLKVSTATVRRHLKT